MVAFTQVGCMVEFGTVKQDNSVDPDNLENNMDSEKPGGPLLKTPSPDSIIGMWCNRSLWEEGPSLYTSTLLLRSNGTGILRVRSPLNDMTFPGGQNANLPSSTYEINWHYDEKGGWEVAYTTLTDHEWGRFRTDGQVLVLEGRAFGGRDHRKIWHRVDPSAGVTTPAN